MFGLTACSNSENSLLPTQEESNLSVDIKLPVSVTRGILEDAATPEDFSLDHAYAYVLRGKKAVETVKAEKVEGGKSLTAKFENIMLDGTEKVLVKINGVESDASLAVKALDIQPSAEKAKLANMIYQGSNGLGEVRSENGVNNYTVDMEVSSIAARVEFAGSPLFNKDLVKSMKMSAVAPMRYTDVYGDPAMALHAKGEGLWFDIADDVELGDKVVANHLFEGDIPNMTIGFKIEKYTCLENSANEYVVYSPKDSESKFFIYEVKKEGEESRKAINKGTMEAPEFTEIIVNDSEGLSIGSKLEGYDFVLEEGVEFFTLNNFEGVEKYEGGHIYLIELDKNLTWNAGDSDFENVFTPDLNQGTEEPVVESTSNITVTATVKAWKKDNSNVSIN